MSLTAPQKTAARMAGVVVTMGAAAWAAVPFYSWFCRVTGYGGTTNVASESASEILEEMVTVRFDANTAPDMPMVWPSPASNAKRAGNHW